MIKVGVFDSGIGGLSVVNAIKTQLSTIEVIFANDSNNVPYGNKTPDELMGLVAPILQNLVDKGSKVIVIACNTVSTTLITQLRDLISVPLIAMEPMVKPAAQLSTTKKIAICATPTTLSSQRYSWLKQNYARDVEVYEPDCSDWSYMIESNQVDHQKIHDQITEVCKKGADVIVLGCTHYHWIEDEIRNVAKDYNTKVLQPEKPVIKQLSLVLEQMK